MLYEMIWYDSSKNSLEARIIAGIEHYSKKYDKPVTSIRTNIAHQTDLDLTKLPGIKVSFHKHIMKNHFFIGSEK